MGTEHATFGNSRLSIILWIVFFPPSFHSHFSDPPISLSPRKKYERDGSSETWEKGRLLGTKMSSYKYSRKKMAYPISQNRPRSHIKKLEGYEGREGEYCTSNDHIIKILYSHNCLILKVHDVYTMIAAIFTNDVYKNAYNLRDHTWRYNEIQRHSGNILQQISQTLKWWITRHWETGLVSLELKLIFVLNLMRRYFCF